MAARRKYYYQDYIPIPGDPKRNYVSPSTGDVISRYQFETLARGRSYYQARKQSPPPQSQPPTKAKKTQAGSPRKKPFGKADFERRFQTAQRTWLAKLNSDRKSQGLPPLPMSEETLRDNGFFQAYDRFKKTPRHTKAHRDAIEDLGFEDDVDYFPDGDTP